MKITAEKGKQNKIHISCDGEYKFTVDAEYWFSCPYHGISEINDDQELTAFFEAVGSRCAFIAGLRLLSYRDHSVKELINKLVMKGHNRNYSEIAAEKLREYGYLNDERYARFMAESLVERKGMSVRAVRTELLSKGISKEIADKLLHCDRRQRSILLPHHRKAPVMVQVRVRHDPRGNADRTSLGLRFQRAHQRVGVRLKIPSTVKHDEPSVLQPNHI